MATDSASPRPLWLQGPTVDLLVGCGLWSLPLLVFTFFLQHENATAVSLGFYVLAVFCNNPHYMATLHRAYGSAADFNQYRFFTLYVTAVMAVALVVVHLVPGLFPWVMTIYLTWSPWHYTGQNFGIAQMFIRRAGAAPDPVARQWLYASYVASFGAFFVSLHSITDSEPSFLSLRIPETLAGGALVFFALAFTTASVLAFTRLARQVPWSSLLPAVLLSSTQFVWFLGPTLLSRFGLLQLPASYFSAGALAFMHCAQYLWITSYYARRERSSTAPGQTRPYSFWHYYLILVIGGLALFVPGPWIASRWLGHDLVESFLIFIALVNVHHFILDGAIWKLRDGRIARLLLGRGAKDAVETLAPAQSFRSHLGWLFGPSLAARWTRYVAGVAILGIGALDQAQNFLTQHHGSSSALARAELLNPRDTRVYFRRAQAALAEGRPDEARRALERILAINPRNAPAQHLLGEIIFRSGDLPAALAHYDHMAALFRPDLSIALNRGLLAQHAGLSSAAAERFEEALKIAPHRTELHFLLGEALSAAGDSDRAAAQYELFSTLFEDDSGSPEERDRLLASYLTAGEKLGRYYESHGQLPEAEKRVQRSADIAVHFRHFHEAENLLLQLAELQEKQGHGTEAAKNRAAAAQARQLVSAK